ncbi:MAG: iron ABC transporter permease [Deltaproteobacteria bacterium]|nr:iron ABC transporter permease [Deltaproteobacteria bacterium]
MSLLLVFILAITALLGITLGSTESSVGAIVRALFTDQSEDAMLRTIIWQIRLPRVLLAIAVGAALSVGGLVFQALLRNPLAEPYILGISGGSAIGAIFGIILGFSRFPGVSLMAFTGSIATLGLILLMSSGRNIIKKESLLLSGVMVNSFCSAVIMFLISLTQDARLHSIMFWLMGDLSQGTASQAVWLMVILLPCFGIIFLLSNKMNLLLMGKDLAHTSGVNIRQVSLILLVVTSFMVSATVSHCGLLGFVGLVMPHTLRLLLGADHRVLVPACILGGGSYLVLCDVLARTLLEQGEMPAGVITAMVGAPLFIYLLKRSK